MKVEVNQTVKKYKINAVYATKTINVVLQPAVKKTYKIEVAQVGARPNLIIQNLPLLP